MNKQPRTVFLPVSMPSVFKNLVFFEGSVFDRLKNYLKEKNDLRVVLIVQKKRDYEKYLPVFGPLTGPNFIYEGIDVPLQKSIFQKLFYFFYSYLIYTDTTRILATMGMRPDEPPAGGKRFLSPLKWLVANTLGRSNFIKRKAVPYLFLKIFRGRPFQGLFDAYQPDLVFASHIYGWFDQIMLAEAKRRGIKTLGMPASWDHMDKYFMAWKADELLAPSIQVKDAAVSFQAYRPEEVSVVGYSYFDFITDQKNWVSKKDTLASLKFPESSRVIIYISGSTYCPDEPDIIETIIKWMDEGHLGEDARLVIRPYYGGRGKDKEFDEQKFNRFEEHPRVAFYKREFWGDLEKSKYFVNLLRHSSLVIATYSTALMEASIFDKPIMALAFDGYKQRPLYRSIRRFKDFVHFQDVIKTGALKIAYDFPQLLEYAQQYLEDPTIDAAGRAEMREQVCYKLDGKSSERIFDRIMESLNK
jgi:hypothetical protein